MVTGGSVDGLVSGMQTSSVIASLMQVEAAPQTALKAKVSTQQKVVSAYQSINTKMGALLTAAKALTDPLAFKSATATASSDAVLATTSTTGSNSTGSVSFRVTKLAASETHLFSNGSVASTGDTVVSGSSIDISINGAAPTSVPITDGSLKGVVDAINKTPNLGVKASAIQIGPSKYTLQLTSSTTGQASTFAVNGVDGLGTDVVTTEGSDAELSIGTKNPVTITSSSNTFTGLMDGLTITAKKVTADSDPPVTVNVSSDTDGIAAKVQAMVDAANATLTEIASQTKNASGTDTTGGTLAGNSSMQQLASSVLQTVSGGAGNLGSLKSVGIQLTRDGRLSFDKAAFTSALNADPVKTQSYFVGTGTNAGNGLADKMSAMADKATQSNTGTLASLISSGNSMIKSLNDNISDWDTRLAQRQQTLQRQFTAMETALGSLKNQSSWLAGQLSSLG
ncbi:flagellar filament capping protein FliD [Dactylosporangium sp. CA-139066]|uniref:flagellar filament capping protein FliD n=1 Tax=Dactylosporangium sp. CA-139066 TaxID=3239930 RepID=UPI003D944D5C